MSSVVSTSVFGGNLGDILWTTPLARHVQAEGKELVVYLRAGDAKAEATSYVLKGLARVMYVANPGETPQAAIKAHVTQRILTAYGHGGKPSVPRIVLTADEIKGAVEMLTAYGLTPDSVAIVNHNSANGDPTNYRAHYVRPPSEVMQKLCAFHRKGGRATVFQFGPAEGYYTWDPFEPLDGAVHIRGLGVRELAACYHVIGRLISGDTGDYHLGLAVGAKVACLVPPYSDQMGYRHWDLLYDQTCWGDETPRVCYTLHSDWTSLLSTDLFKTIG